MEDLSIQKHELERQNQQLLDAYSKLDRAMAQYAELYDNAPVGYLSTDFDRRIVKTNLTCCALLKRDRIVMQGMDLLDLVTKGDRSSLLECFERVCRRTGKLECEVRLHNGTPVLLAMEASTVLRECRMVLLDITKQKQAEEALRESERRFKSLVEVTSDWVWEVNEKGVYTYVSPKVYDLLGYGPEEVLGKTPFDLMPAREAERLLLVFGDFIARRVPIHNLRNINLRKDGKEVVLETSGVPVFDDEGNFSGFRGIDRDITER